MFKLRILLQCNYLYYLLLVLSLLSAGLRIYIIKYQSIFANNITTISGTLINYQHTDTKYILTIRNKETVLIYYYTEDNIKWLLGSTIEFNGELSEPINNTIPNNFNYKKYLNNHKIYYIMNATDYKILDSNNNILYKIKTLIQKRIDSFSKTSDYLNAFILGDKSGIQEQYNIYQKNGVCHLFAISGMHMSVLSIGLLFIFKKFKHKQLYTIILLIIYASICVYSASLIRSLIFFILLTINKKFDINIPTKNILIITSSFLICYNPLIIFDIGFQYSIIVCYGLIICHKYYRKNKLLNILIVSIIAFIFSLPITLINNYEMNLLSIFNNLIFVPLISFIVYPLSLITFILPLFEPILYLIIKFMEYLNEILYQVKIFTIIIPQISIYFYLIYYLFILFFIKTNDIKLLFLSFLLLLSFKIKPYLDNNSYVYFIDVGQGDSTLIYNKKEVILIDTGGLYNYQISDNVIIFLKSLGLNHIDLLLLTHGDSDHIKDAPNIINNFNVKNVKLNNNEINDLEQLVIDTNVNIVDKYQSKLDFKIYDNYVSDEENDSSQICVLTINSYRILFMGDAPQGEEESFLKDYQSTANIIKLGHHGSKTSSGYNFLESLKVSTAIISSGRNNLFHHPSEETIETLASLNINYYNTQTSGTIEYVFNNNTYSIIEYVP